MSSVGQAWVPFAGVALCLGLALLAAHGVQAGLSGYDDRLAGMEFHGHACVPYNGSLDNAVEPGADIRFVRDGATQKGIAKDGVLAYRFNGASNLYTDPTVLEPDHQGWVSLGPGGYVLARLEEPVHASPGVELLVGEQIGQPEQFCLYGATSANGPWHFIGWWHAQQSKDTIAFDLDDRYMWNGGGKVVSHVLVVDADLPGSVFAAMEVERLDAPHNLTGAPGVVLHDTSVKGPFVTASRLWDFGDGQTSTLESPAHRYDDDGVYNACLTLTASTGIYGPTCRAITVNNRPPVAVLDIEYPEEGTMVVRGSQSHDNIPPDGHIVSWQWELPGGASSAAIDPGPVAGRLGDVVCLTVTDDDGAATRRCVDGPLGLPPTVAAPLEIQGHVGVPMDESLGVADPEGDQTWCRLLSGPPQLGVTADCRLLYTPHAPERVCFEFTVQDISGHVVQARRCVTAVNAAADRDADGIEDHADNCPGIANRLQQDADGDGRGDACDQAQVAPDGQEGPRPGAAGTGANPPITMCEEGPDLDRDGVPDACDRDMDGDGAEAVSGTDNCPRTPNPDQRDVDGDGRGDACSAVTLAPAAQPACTGACRGVTLLAEDCPGCPAPPTALGARQMGWIGLAFLATLAVVAAAAAFIRGSPKRPA